MTFLLNDLVFTLFGLKSKPHTFRKLYQVKLITIRGDGDESDDDGGGDVDVDVDDGENVNATSEVNLRMVNTTLCNGRFLCNCNFCCILGVLPKQWVAK